jgi:hypothetical protein
MTPSLPIAGLTLIGDPRPIPAEILAGVAEDLGIILPRSLAAILTTWGPGLLCGMFPLEDPSDRAENGRFHRLQRRLREEATDLRASGYSWAQIPEAIFARAMVLAVDRRGAALVLLPSEQRPSEIVLLHPRGHVVPVGTFEELVSTFLVGGEVEASRVAILHDGAHGDWRRVRWYRDEKGADLGVPATYHVSGAPPVAASEPVLAALLRGDEAAADAELAQALAENVALFLLLDLLAELTGERGAGVPAELRASYTEQLLRMAKRRSRWLAKELPGAELVKALASGGPVAAELVLPLRRNSVAEPFEGVFSLESDRTSNQRRAERVAPLPDAEARGFVAPPGFPPAEAEIAAHVAAWRRHDPHAPIGLLLDRIREMHPGVRQGIALLIARLVESSPFDGQPYHEEVQRHLERDLESAWPMLTLALRSDRDEIGAASRFLLHAHKVAAAAPFFLSIIRRPHRLGMGWEEELADAYMEVATPARELVDEFVDYLPSRSAAVRSEHRPQEERSGIPRASHLHLASQRLLVDFADDDRVFLGYLATFGKAHPFAGRALSRARRMNDPRVIPALHEQLAHERRRALAAQEDKVPPYSQAFGVVAAALAKLGDAKGKEAHAEYMRSVAWWRRQWS